MKLSFPVLGGFLLVPFLCLANSFQPKPQQEPKEAAVSSETTSSAQRKDPVKATPENLASAKKFFGYDCAMCHGATGDGKSDLATSMGLKMNDWRDSSTLASMSDGEIFDVIVKGKGKMTGEGNRVSSEKAWELVNYVRLFAKKTTASIPNTGASRSPSQ
jgi:mono/diheme cytochrome c family protein